MIKYLIKKTKEKKLKKVIILILIVLIILLFNPIKNLILRGFYPILYQEYVEKYSEEYGVDPLLVYSVIKAESNYNENANSSQKAKGLMQIMEETGQEIALKIGVAYETDKTLYIPEENIAIGIKYLSELINHYNRKLYVSSISI